MRWLQRRQARGDHGRARRFKLQAPIEYRAVDSPDWLSGRIENLSCTGVLFQPSTPLEVDAPVAMRFRLPAELTGPVPVEAICAGRVVRQADPGSQKIAVAISDCYVTAASPKPGTQPQVVRQGPERATFIHELNNDLAAIVGYCDLLLLQGQIDPSARESIEHIKNAGLRAASVTRRMVIP